MLPDEYIDILKMFYEKLKKTSANWAVTGSTSFIVQGIPLEPNDIDIQTDKISAYEIENIFYDYIVQKVRFTTSDKIKSHFGVLKINDIRIEIMGDIQKRVGGSWELPVDITQYKKYIIADGFVIPVLDLKYEYEAYLKLGRTVRAKLIKNYIK